MVWPPSVCILCADTILDQHDHDEAFMKDLFRHIHYKGAKKVCKKAEHSIKHKVHRRQTEPRRSLYKEDTRGL